MEARKLWIHVVGIPVAARQRGNRDRHPFLPATAKRAERGAEEPRFAGSRKIDKYLRRDERK